MTLRDLVNLIEQHFPEADYHIGSVVGKKRAVGTWTELEAYVWPAGRTIKARGITPEQIWRQLEPARVLEHQARLAELDVPDLARRERA